MAKNRIIYLAGKCNGLSITEQNLWRVHIKNIFECNYDDVIVINPNDYFNYFQKLHKTNKQVKEYYMSLIDKSDLVIVNLNNSDSSVGTGQELEHARMMNIPIVGFGTEHVYPWEAEVDCQVVFDNIEECIDYVNSYYLNLR